MKKVILLLIIMTLFTLCSFAKSPKSDFQTIISNSEIPKSSVAISVKNLSSKKNIYSLNDKILMHPASVQKILTLPAAMDVLGDNYEFRTSIFSRNNEAEYLIKLGADPYLSSKDLKSLVKVFNNEKIQKIYIDDTILERKDWGEGWQWDDDMNIYMPRFNAYNLDNNIMKITVMPAGKGELATIINPSKYPIAFFNNVVTSDTNSVQVTRDDSISSNALTLNGTVKSPTVVTLPLNNLKRYFNVKLTNILGDRNIYLKSAFVTSKQTQNDKMITEVTHPISIAETDILQNSNNMVMETVMKLAGGKYYNTTGTDVLGINIFNSFCEKNGVDNSEIRIVDASGVSKNNLVNADFVTEYLVKLQDNSTLAKMAKPGEGTLANRMIPLKDNLNAKTGTLSDISSIAGFLTAKSGKKYAFCIMINDPKSKESDKKSLEDYLIREMYLKL